MPDNYVRKFRIKHDKAWAWHIGLFFCVEPKDETGKRDIYICFSVLVLMILV